VHQLLFSTYYRAVTSLYAASDGVAYHAGALMVSLGIPLIGLICLVIGLWDRSRRRRQAHPGYPDPPGPPAPPMGYPGPYPGPPYPAYPPYGYPQQRTAKSATAFIIIGAVLLAFGILGNFARVAADMAGRSRPGATDTSMSVGECITQSAYVAQSFSSRPENDCANPANVDQLATKGGPLATCPDGKRDGSKYDHFSDESTILCFALNLKEGQCYQLTGDVHHPRLSLGDCNDPRPGLVRVVQRIDGGTDKSECPAGIKGSASYPSPPVVYCLDKASE
jgi:hypothetical protein